MIEFSYKLDWRWWLAGSVMAVGVIGLSYAKARGGSAAGWRFALFALRLLSVASLVVCLLDPERVEEFRHYQPSCVAVMVDTSRSMGWEEQGGTRLKLAQDWLKKELKTPPNFQVSYFGFNSNAFPLSNRGDLEKVVADGNQTAYATSLENLATMTSQDAPASVVLLSDGEDNSMKSAESIARTFGERKIPVHTVVIGSSNEPPDIVVENVQVRRALLSQSTAKAVVKLRSSGFAGKSVPLRILKDGKVLVERRIVSKNGDKIYRVGHPTQGYPRTLEELLKYQVVIFSDVATSDFTPEQIKATERFVTEFGGGFAMVGGHTSFGAGGYQHTMIDNLIPVGMEREADLTENTFQPRVADNAWAHPIMRISGDPDENRAIWTTKFPPLQGYNRCDRAKPGATVLLEHPTDRTDYGPAIILATQEVGRGRTMALTTDTTYLWGEWFETIWGEKIDPNQRISEANCDARYFKQFWLNSVRWLAAHRFDFEADLVGIDVAQTYGAPNLDIPVRVRAANRGGQETADAEVTLHLWSETAEVQRVRAIYSEEQRCYQASVKLPSAGKYRLQATAAFADGKTAEDQQILIGEDVDREMADIRVKPDALAAISRWSGGQVFSPGTNNAAAMAQALSGSKPSSVEYRKSPVWDKSWCLGTIIGLLTIEWGIRRLRGMS